MANEIPKVCATCEHFYFDSGEPHYSSLTPGSDMEMRCQKGHWVFENHNETEASYRRKMLTALQCDDYELVKL